MRPRVPWYRRSWLIVGLIFLLAVAGLIGWKAYRNWQQEQTLQQAIAALTAREPYWQLESWPKTFPPVPDHENLAEVVFQWKSKWVPDADLFGLALANMESTPANLLNMMQLDLVKQSMSQATKLPEEMETLLKLHTGYFPIIDLQSETFRVMRRSVMQQQLFRNAAQLLKYQIELWLNNRQTDHAVRGCLAMLKLPSSFRYESSIISLLLALGNETQACAAIERTLALSEPSPEQLQTLQAKLLEMASQRFFIQGLRGERATLDRFLREVQDGRYSRGELTSLLGLPRDRQGLSGWLDSLFDKIRERAQGSPYGNITEERIKQLTFFQTLLDRMEHAPEPMPGEMQQLIEEQTRLSTTVAIFAPGLSKFYEADLKSRAMLQMAAALVASERYRLSTGKMPTGWIDLVPSFYPTVPVDPYDGKPLRWKETATGFLLYSIWMNQKDDGGNIRTGDLQPTDFGVEYFAVAHRRQPPVIKSWPRNLPRPLDDKEAFFAAARSGDVSRLTMLLDRGYDVNTTTDYGATALCYAAENGHLDAMKLLIERKIDIHKKDTFYSADALTWALMKEKDEAVMLLLKAGAKGEASVLSNGISNNKPKLVAAALATGRIKQELLDSSLAKLNEKQTEISKMLLAAGAKVLPKTKTDEKKTEVAKTPPAKTVEENTVPTEAVVELTDKPKEAHPWLGFRGQFNAGVAEGQFPPTAWDATTGKNLAWKTPLPGLGLSCPVIWGNKVFLTTAINQDSPKPSLRIGQYGDVDSVQEKSVHVWKVYCLALDTGKVLWERTAYTGVPKTKRHMKSSHANATVATEGNVVVVNFGSEGLYCYGMDGTLNWRRDLGKLGSSWFFNPDYEWGFGSSPVIFNDMVIIQCDIGKNSFLSAHHLITGDQLWLTPRDEIPSWCSPTLVPLENGKMELVTVASKYARGYDPETGKERWRLGKFSEIAVPTPFYANGLIYLTTGYRPIQPIFAIKPGAMGDISLPKDKEASDWVLWSKSRGGPYLPTPVAYGEHLYVCTNNGVLSCYEAKTGKLVYQQRLGGKSGYTASLVAADGRLYCTDEDGLVRVVKTGPTFQLLAVNKLGEECLSHPAISNGKIVFRCRDHVTAFEVKK